MGELKASQQEEFSNVAKAQLVTEPTQQHLEHDISGHLNEIERGASPLVAGAIARLAAIHRVAQISGALQLSGVSRSAVRTIHRRLTKRELRAEASLSSRGFYPQFEYSVLTVSTDSTRVLASIRELNRLELVAETFRAVLNELAILAPEWLQEIALEPWYKRYGSRIEQTRLPESNTERERYAQTVGDDIYYLLEHLETSNLLIEWQQLSSIIALQLVWQRHYEVLNDDKTGFKQVRFRPKRELTKAAEGIESPYDIDARYRSRCGVSWTGYLVHLTETCEDDDCHLITQVMTTAATAHEAQCTQAIHQTLMDKDLAPDEHFVDSAYVDAHLLVEAQTQGITIVGPARPDVSWQTRTEEAFDFTRFSVDWQQQSVTCPQGKQSISWIPFNHYGHPAFKVRFSKGDCAACPSRPQCTRAKPPVARSLLLMPQPQYEALRTARAVHASPEGQQRYKRRAGIEGTLSQGVRAFGLRQSRYRGLAKTHLQNIAIAAAINIDRLINWLTGVPRAKTRVSRFAALAES